MSRFPLRMRLKAPRLSYHRSQLPGHPDSSGWLVWFLRERTAMKFLNILFAVAFLTSFQTTAQEMSAEWYRQKNLSWEQTQREYPQSAHPGPFKTRMLEIDAWAKEKDHDLYYNPNKPYLLARMVQDELDADAARQWQASQQIPENPSSRSDDYEHLAGTFKDNPKLSAIIKGHFEPNLDRTAVRIGASIIVLITLAAAWLAYWLLRPKRGVHTAVALGRRVASWMSAFATINLLPAFFLRFDSSSIALWVLVVPFMSLLAFFIGWIIGLIKYKSVNRACESPIQSDGTLSKNTQETSHKY